MADLGQIDPFDRGAQAGIARLERYDLSWDAGSVQEALAMTRSVQQESGEEVSDRFEELFGELVTLAVGARWNYHEPPLTEGDIREYMVHSWTFLNSLRHVA